MLQYKVNILAELKKAGYPTTRIRREKLISESTVQRIRTGNTSLNLENLDVICRLLQCQPGDLVEWVPDDADLILINKCKSVDKKLFGTRLRELRKQKNISQTTLGNLLGVTATQISDMEMGESATSMARLHELCQYFSVSADYFMGLTDDPTPYNQSRAPRLIEDQQ